MLLTYSRPHGRTSLNFLYILALAVARSSSDGLRYYTSGFVDDVTRRVARV